MVLSSHFSDLGSFYWLNLHMSVMAPSYLSPEYLSSSFILIEFISLSRVWADLNIVTTQT